MNTTNMTSGVLGDQETLNDMLSSEKFVTSNLNTFAGECVNDQLRNDFLNILRESHAIQAELFNTANSKGWYPVKQAQASDIEQIRQRYIG
jgi:spore coat protein CotF